MLIEHQKRSSRVRFKHPVRVVTLDGQPRVIRTLTANVSHKGMFVRMPEPLATGTRVALSLEAGGRALALAQAEVVWARVQESHLPGRFAGCGVRFTGFLHPRAEDLVDYLVDNLDRGKPLQLAPPERTAPKWLAAAAAAVLVVLAAGAALVFSDTDVSADDAEEEVEAPLATQPVVAGAPIVKSAPSPSGRGAGEKGTANEDVSAKAADDAALAAAEAADDAAQKLAAEKAQKAANQGFDGAAQMLAADKAKAADADKAVANKATDDAALKPGKGADDAARKSAANVPADDAALKPGAAKASTLAANEPTNDAALKPGAAKASTLAANEPTDDAALKPGAATPSTLAASEPTNDAALKPAKAIEKKGTAAAPLLAANEPTEAAQKLTANKAAAKGPDQKRSADKSSATKSTESRSEKSGAASRGDFDDLAASVDPRALKQTGRTGRVALPSGAASGLSWSIQGTNLVLDPGGSVSRAFLLTNPARAVFDLDGAAPKKTVTLPASGPHMQSVRLGKLPNGTRVVVDLDEPPRSAKQTDGTLVLSY